MRGGTDFFDGRSVDRPLLLRWSKSLTHDGGGDTQAIAQMVKYTLTKHSASANRGYPTGDSSGGMMTEARQALVEARPRRTVVRAALTAAGWALPVRVSKEHPSKLVAAPVAQSLTELRAAWSRSHWALCWRCGAGSRPVAEIRYRLWLNRDIQEALVRAVSGSLVLLVAGSFFVGCSGTNGGSGTGPTDGVGGPASVGGATSSNSTPTTGGTTQTGGRTSSGGASAGGANPNLGGRTGSSLASGGTSTGGSTATGGVEPIGGAQATGGSVATGGSQATGGSVATGGSHATGGSTATGGSKATGGTSSVAGGTSVAGAGNATPSSGCGKAPTLKNSPTSTANQNTLMVGGKSRQYLIRWPDNYDKTHPYRLIIGLHGATGKDTDIGPSYFGLFALSNSSTIFVAPSADGGLWSAASDTTFVDEILKAVEADLCIDTTRIMLEGFSQGAAMSWTLACSRPGVFRAAVGHSGGGVANPTTCQPIPYLGSLGLAEGNGQNTQTDQFARWNGCTTTTLPRATTGSHVCTNYTGCPAADPVRWCSYDGGHTPSPTDAGQSTSWMPKEVWTFLSQF